MWLKSIHSAAVTTPSSSWAASHFTTPPGPRLTGLGRGGNCFLQGVGVDRPDVLQILLCCCLENQFSVTYWSRGFGGVGNDGVVFVGIKIVIEPSKYQTPKDHGPAGRPICVLETLENAVYGARLGQIE